MRVSAGASFNNSALIKLKDQDWLDKQRVAGKIAAQCLTDLEKLVQQKSDLSLLQMNELTEKFIVDSGGFPTFKGYKGFPSGVCISVNQQLVHGIPTDYHLQDGDIVSFDLGVTYQGAIADTAITCIYGTPKSDRHVDLLRDTKASLMKGIEAIQVGKRLGCIGHAIYRFARNKGYGVVDQYGGHGLDWDIPHAAPFVANKSEPDQGIRIQSGLVIAVEPMLTLGSPRTHTSSDGWTVITDDLGSHQEHSIFVHSDHVEILTWRENENNTGSNRIYFNKTTA
jgi:methionyl aminopeptidase